uniref:Protein kinase domain-containing protein n=1 Tax=Heterorhabditis bacteriophora TaxID=37862 RepID=A0A1I7X8M0_HETBA
MSTIVNRIDSYSANNGSSMNKEWARDGCRTILVVFEGCDLIPLLSFNRMDCGKPLLAFNLMTGLSKQSCIHISKYFLSSLRMIHNTGIDCCCILTKFGQPYLMNNEERITTLS